VALSIGGGEPIDRDHLERLRQLCARYQPALVSEHLAWSTHEGVYFNDLLPVAYDKPTLLRVCAHIEQVQEALQRRILLENPSTYVAFARSTYSETDFLEEIAQRAGCGLLLDVNNIHVSAVNHGLDASAVLRNFPFHHVGEIHVAGAAPDQDSLGAPLLIDAHDRPASREVLDLYAQALVRCGATPTLLEWDNDVPDLAQLLEEVTRIDAVAAQAANGRAA
jgi:hypothetical protein